MTAGIIAVVAIALIAIIFMAMRKRPAAVATPATSSSQPSGEHDASTGTAAWTGAEGDEFASLSEAQRCDFIFAIQDLAGEERTQTLRAALDDPSEVVAFAAATALTARGERALVEHYFSVRPGARSDRLRSDLSLLTGSTTASS